MSPHDSLKAEPKPHEMMKKEITHHMEMSKPTLCSAGSVFPQSKMKARPSGQTQAISLDDGTEEEFEMYASTTMNQPITENPEFKAIQDRMLNLENALSRVIHHLESKIEEVTQ